MREELLDWSQSKVFLVVHLCTCRSRKLGVSWVNRLTQECRRQCWASGNNDCRVTHDSTADFTQRLLTLSSWQPRHHAENSMKY